MVTRASVEVAREIYADFRLNLPSIFERDTVTIIHGARERNILRSKVI